jgi:hypothetical protein
LISKSFRNNIVKKHANDYTCQEDALSALEEQLLLLLLDFLSFFRLISCSVVYPIEFEAFVSFILARVRGIVAVPEVLDGALLSLPAFEEGGGPNSYCQPEEAIGLCIESVIDTLCQKVGNNLSEHDQNT